MIIPIDRSGLAIAAGYLGLVSVIYFFATIALVLGILAIRDIKKHPDKHGMGRAVFGIVMGAIFTVVLLIFIIAVIVASISGR
jgi:ABC-type dipeptide/oligopeptide/nickel transport system permease component